MVAVELFPTQTETDALFVIVLAPTGVTYSNQCGGNACDQKQAAGFLVPVGTPADLAAVAGWFRQRFSESCYCDGRLATEPSAVRELAAVVADIPCWAVGKPVSLGLDAARLTDGGEAWVPVLSPHGPGWLTWTNSD